MTGGATDWLRYQNQSATRNLPVSPRLTSALGFLPEMGVTMEVFSGGQPAPGGGPRVGSTRHDHGEAADVFFYKDGRKLDWANPQDRPLFQDIVRRAKANGVTGFGAGEGYMQPGSMHIGFGEPAVWGAGGKGANAPQWLREAYEGSVRVADASGAQGGLKRVTDPALLEMLNAPQAAPSGAPAGLRKVTDPDILRQLNGEAETPAEQPSVSRGEALGRGALQGATFGFSDEIAGGTIDRKTYQERYIALRREGLPHAEAEQRARQEGFGAADARTEEVRAANAAAQEARPGYYMGGEIGGAIATGLLPGGAVSNAMRGGSLAARSAAGGATAGAQGAAYGFGTGEGGVEARLQNAGEIGAIGAGAGAAIPFFGRAISQIASVGGKGRAAAQLRQAAPAVQELQQSARALFDAAERSGVKINSQAYDNMVGGLAKKMTDEGMDEMLHPAAARVLSRLQGAAGSEPTMAELMTLRRVLSMGANDVTNRDQTRLVSMMVDEFDDYLANLKPRDFLSGSGPSKQALADWKEARDLWSRSLKAGVIEDAFTRAGNAASGLENGLRTEFRRILNNPKMVRRFSPEERKAIGQVANGTVSANVLRKLSRFGFGLTGERNFLGGSIGAAGGAATLGPAGAIIVPALGMAASKGAETVAKRGAQTARAMAATGQVPAVKQIATDELERLLLRAAPGVPASQ